jgi:hypothetical protein
VAAGATDQATFNTAIGTATITGVTAVTSCMGSFYDTTNGQAVIFDALSTATSTTVIETSNVIR